MKEQPMRGRWSPGTDVHQVDRHFVGTASTSAEVRGSGDLIELTVNAPSVHPLYYVTHKNFIFWDESKTKLVDRLRKIGWKASLRVNQVAGMSTVRFNGKRTETVQHKANTIQTYRHTHTLEDAVEGLSKRMTGVVNSTVEADGEDRVAVCLSGGTDSLLVAAYLKESGVDIEAVSVGLDPDVFDVAYARKYAEQLDIPFTFLQLPDSESEMKKLIMDTIRLYEAADLSNVLMGACNLMIRDWAEEQGIKALWQGYYADRLLGHSLTMKSNFLKRVANPTDVTWSNHRNNLYSDVTNNDLQVAKTLRGGKTFWRTPFLHPSIREYVASLPLSIVPCGYKDGKPLFERLADRFVEDGSWLHGKKQGYYTGSGIGKLQRKYPFMTDKGLRTLKRLIDNQ